ncbi:hypothetical protein CPLU01_03035 [Colletotrichum plurivorum]|uniref:Ankyrin repeat protein n=1 Tax=Colletotrichum plurivorum TaxID=2175906 RepID=A0A8H6KUA1_9PEZI|nr:hypothetical protein CPLU01_03035 [Colletotrichum plurivorum]
MSSYPFLTQIQDTALNITNTALGALNNLMASMNPTDNPEGRSDPPPGEYKPTPIDVIVVRVMLEKAAHLPPEVLDMVFDLAEYWPHSTAFVHYPVNRNDRSSFSVRGSTQDENKLILRCPPVGFLDYRRVGEAFKDAPLPPKSVNGSAVAEPLRSLTLAEPSDTSTEPARDAPREYFAGSMTQPPALTHPVRKIVFKTRSKDQGWGGQREHHGTYHGSWTWFEAGLEKFDSERKCDGSCKGTVPDQQSAPETSSAETSPDRQEAKYCTCGLQSVYPPVVVSSDGRMAYHHHVAALENLKIQANKTAHKHWLEHEVVWSWTDDTHPESPEADRLVDIGRGRGTGTGRFVRSLKLGDVVTVWGKARFGGWTNNIEFVKVEIYWAI